MRPNLKSFYPDYFAQASLFAFMSQAPWGAEVSKQMDIAYISSWSGAKPAASIFDEFLVSGNLNKQALADMLWSMYGISWSHLWNAYVSEYNPLDSYKLTETVERSLTNDRTIDRNVEDNGTVGVTGEDVSKIDQTRTRTDNLTASTEGTTGTTFSTTQKRVTDTTESEDTTVNYGKVVSSSQEQDQYTYGFNSIEKVPTSVVTTEGTDTQSGKDTTERSLTGTSTIQDSGGTTTDVEENNTLKNTGTQTTDDKGENVLSTTRDTSTSDTTIEKATDNQDLTESITRTRSGNTGQYPYQELLLREFELWKWSFFKQVFADCDCFLTLSVYS